MQAVSAIEVPPGSTTAIREPLPAAGGLLRRLLLLYVYGTLPAVSTTLVLVFIGVELSKAQWLKLLAFTPAAMCLFVLPDLYLITRHFRPLEAVLRMIERGQTPSREAASAALVRTLNLPFYSFMRVTFLHGPLASLSSVLACLAANTWWDGGFAYWQILIFAALILFFASPTHAVIEFFSLSRKLVPVVEGLWPYCDELDRKHQQELIAVGLKSKLLYLCVFITALPLLFVAFSVLFKVVLMLRGVGVEVTVEMMTPLVLWILGVLTVCFAGSLLMSVLTAMDVSRSAARLIAGMNEVERGNLDVDLKVLGTDEYADLTRGFNLMTDGLRDEVRILEVSQDLAGELQLEVLIGRIMNAAAELLDAERSTLFLHDPARQELVLRFGVGLQAREIRIPETAGIAGAVFSSGRAENIPDPYADPRFNPEVDLRTGFRTRSILCLPIVNKKGQRIGVTQVLNRRNGAFNHKDEQRLRAFTAQVAIALENAQLFNEVLRIKNYNENILASTTNGVVTLDNDGRIVTANSAALKILGCDEAQALQQPAQQVFGEDNAWVLRSLERLQGSRLVDSVVDAELLRADGSRAFVNLSASPLNDEDGEVIGSVLSFEDLSGEKRVKTTMARYMSQEVVDQLLQAGEAELGGKQQKVSILFSDVRGFTTAAEALGPRETVSMLNEYFEEMVEVILRHGGILDKYIGDAMMALFGAPFSGIDDADRAVAVANEWVRVLRLLNRRRAERGQPPMDMGVGISTGEVIVGSIGSTRRMEYTVIGDSVNLASRLEGATKQYGVRILLSEHTVQDLHQPALLREIDRLRVKGKDHPVTVFEALDHREDRDTPDFSAALKAYEDGLASYRARRWVEAQAAFAQCLSLQPEDRPAQLYLERCRHYDQTPPPEHWDGVWVLKEK